MDADKARRITARSRTYKVGRFQKLENEMREEKMARIKHVIRDRAQRGQTSVDINFSIHTLPTNIFWGYSENDIEHLAERLPKLLIWLLKGQGYNVGRRITSKDGVWHSVSWFMPKNRRLKR